MRIWSRSTVSRSCCRKRCVKSTLGQWRGQSIVFRSRKPLRLNLALQGGGAHGAFTWGVLDGLLEDDRLEFACVSGTSAGAVNAAALASGLADAQDGRAAARSTLRAVWEGVEKARVPDLMWLNPLLAGSMASMAQRMSPYEFNPLGFDPLRRLLNSAISFSAIRASSNLELLIAATDVSTGRARLFRRPEITVDTILASACLPAVHHAVEIDGQAYWDGGFSANPDLITLASTSPVEDTLIIVLNQTVRPKLAKTAPEIAATASEITFNQPFLRDVEMIAAARETEVGWLAPRHGRIAKLRRHRFHVIEAGRHTANLATDTKMKPDAALLSYLFGAGRTEAARWLGRHRAAIGVRDSAELEARYLSPQSWQQRAAADDKPPPAAMEPA